MWHPEMYSPIASFLNGNLNINEPELPLGGVVYLLDFGIDRIYIGSTVNFKLRLSQHVEQLRKGNHTSSVQQSYNESNRFNAYVLLNLPNATIDELRDAEKSMIRLVRPRLNQNMPDKSTLRVNRNWRKEIVSIPKIKQNLSFISLINTTDGPKTPSSVRELLNFLHQYYHDEFMESVNEFFFRHTFHAYPRVSLEIKEKARELFILMKNQQQ